MNNVVLVVEFYHFIPSLCVVLFSMYFPVEFDVF